MRVELINTGTELLLGSVINTHLKFVAEAIFPLGLRIARQIAVPDGAPIRAALHESLLRAEIILVTGGLGPTTDDLTRDIAAELLDLDLEHDE
ncbi:MAG TPA: molybdopterin-binding protein, partial [Chthoniobacteraceae bacterium]|nr:molybdopterin-binding protein [Chthoniobacteraceae bacterium]